MENLTLVITVCHHSASFVIPIDDPHDRFFYPTLTLIMNYYNLLYKIGFVDLLCFFLSCVCYAFLCVCLYVPCGHLLGNCWSLGSRWWGLNKSLALSHWYPGSGVVLDCINS